MTGGNGFEIVCDVVGHSHELLEAIRSLSESQIVTLQAIYKEVAQANEMTCRRCSAIFVVRLFLSDKEGLVISLKEKS